MGAEPDTCDLLCLDLPKAEVVRSNLPASEVLATWAAAARALADPTRLAVALALARSAEACVCDMAWIVGRDEKLVSHHARALRTAGLARSTRRGKMVMYELTARGHALVDAIATEPEPAA
jgi:DNA-binding transcriptional ArsR family regulator